MSGQRATSTANTVHTVGLLGSNGRVGSAILSASLEPSRHDKINLVLLHRPGSSPKAKLPSHVQVRSIDLQGEEEGILQAVQGIQVFV